jgi:hypothetical protein
MGDNIMAIIITEDGSFELEEGLSGVIHETAEAFKSRQRDEEDQELAWKQKFYQDACRKLRSTSRPPHLPVGDTEDEIYEDLFERR